MYACKQRSALDALDWFAGVPLRSAAHANALLCRRQAPQSRGAVCAQHGRAGALAGR